MEELETGTNVKKLDQRKGNQENNRQRLTLNYNLFRLKMAGKHDVGREIHKQDVLERNLLA